MSAPDCTHITVCCSPGPGLNASPESLAPGCPIKTFGESGLRRTERDAGHVRAGPLERKVRRRDRRQAGAQAVARHQDVERLLPTYRTGHSGRRLAALDVSHIFPLTHGTRC